VTGRRTPRSRGSFAAIRSLYPALADGEPGGFARAEYGESVAGNAPRTPSAAVLPGRVLTAGPLALDLATREVRWNGATLPAFRPREFALLVTLIGEPGRVFTKRELETAVLGYDGLVGSRAIDQHVVKLRAKLPDPTVIRTVRGVGYGLVAG
jgi:DNA-binding response OmpR family regulator